MKKRFTKQEKAEYFKKLRDQWKAAKAMSANNKEIEGIARSLRNHGRKVGSIYFDHLQFSLNNKVFRHEHFQTADERFKIILVPALRHRALGALDGKILNFTGNFSERRKDIIDEQPDETGA